MKKVTALFIAFVLCLGVATVAIPATLGQEVNTLPLGSSIQATTTGGAGADNLVGSSMQGNVLYVGNQFTVTFTKSAFQWLPTQIPPNTGHGGGNLNTTWVQIEDPVMRNHIAVAENGIFVEPVSGAVTVTFNVLAPLATPTTLKIYLQSTGAPASHAFQRQVTISDQASTIVKTKAGGTAPVASTLGNVTLNTGDSMTFTVPANNFEWGPGGQRDASALSTLDPNVSWVQLTNAVKNKDFRAEYVTPAGGQNVLVKLTALRAGTYNLSLSMSGGGGVKTVGSPQQTITVKEPGVSSKITGIASGSLLGGTNSGAFLNGKSLSYGEVTSLVVEPGDELLIPFTANFFTWDGTPPYGGSPVTTTQLRQGKIDVRSTNRRGGNIYESGTPDIVNRDGRAYVRLKFAKDYSSLKDIEFSLTIFLTVDRSRDTASQLEIYGLLEREVFDIYEGGYYDISDGSVIRADTYIRNVELYLGNGVTMYTNLLADKHYSGTASNEILPQDEELLRKYPSIDEIIRIKTNSLTQLNSRVLFDTGRANYYVYNSNGEYLGRSNTRLPYSPIYYLSSKQIDMSEESEEPGPGFIQPEPGEDPPPEKEWNNWTTPPNGNDNPGTGR